MRPAEALSLMALLAAVVAGGTATAVTSVALYHAGLRALQDGACEAADQQFDAFFAENPGYVRPPHPFYFDVLRAVEACRGTLIISGVGQDGGALPPLPWEPPPIE